MSRVRRMIISILAALAACVALPWGAQADVPKVLTYQGYLTDDNGKPMVGSTTISFRLYDADSGGTALWSEELSVTLQGGHFTVILGATTPMALSLFTANKQLYLGVKVDEDPEMTPRAALTSVPFARIAENVAPGATINANSIQINGQPIINDKGEWKGAATGLKGDKGEKGDKGDPGSVKTFQCPYGTFLKGVDAKGDPICATTSSNVVPYNPTPTSHKGASAPTTAGFYGLHAFNDTTLAAAYQDTTNNRVLIYYSTNSGSSWSAGATISASNLNVSRIYLYRMASGDPASFVLFWRDTSQKKSGILQVTNQGRSISNRVNLGDSNNGYDLKCNDNKVCVLHHGYYVSPTYYYRVYTSTNGGSSWTRTYNGTGTGGTHRVRDLVWTGTRWAFISQTYSNSKYQYNFFRGSAAGSSWSRTLQVTDTSISFRNVQGDIIQLNSSPQGRMSTNGGSTWSTGVPGFFGFPSTASSDCYLRSASKELFCRSSCSQRLDPSLTLPYKCVSLPNGVSSFPRTTVTPSGKYVYYHDGSYVYRFTR